MKTIHTLNLFLLVTLSHSAQATNYYVSNSGSDSNDGLSLPNALATLQHAADIVVGGDSVLVENGTYAGFALWSGGSENARIVFKALGDEVLINAPASTNDGINIENADYVTIDGFMVNDQPRNGIRLVLANHCVVRNCSCDNNFERGIFTGFTDDILIEYNICTNSIDEHGIYVSNSSDRPVIRYNECYGNNNTGIHMNGDLSEGGDGIISDAEVYGNIVHDNNRAAGINMDGVENPKVYNNLIYNNHFSQGIALFQQDGAVPSRGAKIFNNTIIVPPDGRWGILVNAGANVNTQIFNNIIINHHDWRGSITAESTAGFQSDYNILINSLSNAGDGSSITLAAWQALGFDLNSLPADPLTDIFVDPGNKDFHLKSGSQAINAGTSAGVSPYVQTDLEGNSRPIGNRYDIGAYEYATTTAIPKNQGSLPLLLYPNPFNREIYLANNTQPGLTYVIYDLLGRAHARGRVEHNTIEAPELPAGYYLLEIRDERNERLAFYRLTGH